MVLHYSMAIICLFILLLLLFSNNKQPAALDEDTEKCISRFILEYAQRTGNVLTRDAALALMRAAIEAEEKRLLKNQDPADQAEKAQLMVKRICAEAERKAAPYRRPDRE